MNNYIHLIGAEEVGRAGHNMLSAAEQMQRAANQFDASVDRLIQAFSEHEMRMVEIMKGQA